jgi:aryl-alcohol dehydrogenase-like predicted oxidoreductase
MSLIAPLEAVLPPIDILSGRVKWRRLLRKAFCTAAKARFLLLRSAKSGLDLPGPSQGFHLQIALKVFSMKYKSLGRTDISVSEICLGTMTWGSQNSETDAHAQMDYAVEKGVNFFDTAELYPTTPVSPETQGWTEDYIGSWFEKTGKRSEIVLATKVAGRGRDYLRGGEGADARNIRLALEASLKRLKTDYVDLYQVHWPNRGHFHFRQNWSYNPFNQDRDKAVANMLEILETLGALVKEGKIRAIGLSNETTWGIQKYLTLSEQKNLPRVASVQNEYNLLYRHFDLDLAELAHYEDVGLLAYSPLAGGILTGKYVDGGRPKGSRASINPDIGGRLQPLQEPARCRSRQPRPI